MKRLANSRTLNASVKPFLLTVSDPAYRKPRVDDKNYRKYLTIINQRRIIERVKRLIRKDNKMAKDKYKLNRLQIASAFLLACGAAFGFTELLGGEVRDAVGAALIVGGLFFTTIEK